MNDIQNIKSSIDILDIVSTYVHLDSHHRGKCPFHEDTNPSFSVNPEGQYFHCFGCGVGGDVIRFIELHKGMSFKEALSDLAGQIGIEIKDDDNNFEQVNRTRTITQIRTEAAQYYVSRLTNSLKTYMQNKRGFTDETIKRFMIGFADGKLHQHLIDTKHFDPELCVEAGVLQKSNNGYRDFFYKRIVFPIISHGQVVSFTARAVDDTDPKYLHLPGKMEHMYNEDAARHKQVFIVEGPTDCMALEQAGYHAIALNGLSLKSEHADKFNRCETIFICVDGDKAGRQRVLTIADLFGDRARIVSLPDGLDPNDFLRQRNAVEFTALVQNAQEIVEYEIGCIPEDIPPTSLPQTLSPILKRIAAYDKPRAESLLRHVIAPRFRLKKPDLDAYRSSLTGLRKELKQSDPGEINSDQAELTAVLPGLVDIVLDEGRPVFLMKEEDSLVLRDTVKHEGALYAPPSIENIPFLLVQGQDVINEYQGYQRGPESVTELNRNLFDDLVSYHHAISELPRNHHYPFIAAWVIHTYFQDSINFSPILCLYAEPERGKTRTGLGIVYVCYRGLHLESLREAFIFRAASDYNATLFFDVLDMWKKLERANSTDLILHRFQKGAKVARVLYPEKGPHQDTVYYNIFGPTIIGTNMPVHNILETRALQINMPESRRLFDNDVTAEAALPLKARLLTLRAYYLGKRLPDCPKPVRSRLGDIMRPMLQVIRFVNPAAEEEFQHFITELQDTRKLERSESREAKIVQAISELMEVVENGVLSVKAITDYLNRDIPERYKVKPNSIGKKLSSLGFEKKRTSDGHAGIHYDEDLLTRLFDRYGLNDLPENGVLSVETDIEEVPF